MAVLIPAVWCAKASATALPSSIKENMTLTSAGSPYTGGSTTIEGGVVVKIEPGVKLTLGSMVVKGTLKVEGTAEEPVVFTGAKEASAGEWCTIQFESGSSESVIDHAEVKYGGGCGSGSIFLTKGVSPTIVNSTISHSSSYGINVEEGVALKSPTTASLQAAPTLSATRRGAPSPARSTSTGTKSKAGLSGTMPPSPRETNWWLGKRWAPTRSSEPRKLHSTTTAPISRRHHQQHA
jgi:hypothetical protein